ncbi:MAG TPA: hypothetical protein VEO01_11550 [Pseudonocardiaceae bacterium]|nr:hypothetical protein [Pseudonocardiaceae bacterium]
MDRTRTGTGRMARLLTRVLFVLGGTVAVTALGWLISSTTASAATLPDLNVPGTHANPAGGVTGVLTSLTLPAAPTPTVPKLPASPAGTASMSGVAGELRTAVGRLSVDRAVPVAPLIAQPPTSTSAPAGQSGSVSGPAPARPLPTVTTLAPAPAGPATVVESLSPQVTGPVLPAAPHPATPNPVPWSPITVPAAPGGSVGGATGAGGLGLVDTSGTFPVPGLDVVRVIPVTVPLGRVTTGKQPGITPD